MKCNKCYKKIPNGEEMCENKKGYFHEKCLAEIKQKGKEQEKNLMVKLGIGLVLFMFGLTLTLLFLAFKSRKRVTKKRCYYCERLCNNACEEVKRDRKLDLELAKCFALSSLALLSTFAIYRITNTFWGFLILPVLLLIIHLRTI